MFESAEIGRSVSPEDFGKRVPILRERLLEAQSRLIDADFSVILLFAGVDGAGKGATANTLCWWMDPRRIRTYAYERPTDAERERPEWFRFWRDLPRHGYMSIVLSGWPSRPLLQRVYDRMDAAEFERQLDRIASFETMLAANGTQIVKFWMHLGRDQQEERLRTLEQDPLTAWRVRPRDWEHWGMYDQFVDVAERLITRTSSAEAPWHIVEGTDPLYRELKVGALLLETLETKLEEWEARIAESSEPAAGPASAAAKTEESTPEGKAKGGKSGREEDRVRPSDLLPPEHHRTLLETLDLSKTIDKDVYKEELGRLQARLNELHRRARDAGVPMVVVFEGADAAGKGGCIRRLVHAIDARSYRVVQVGPPTDEEKQRHYLWRFWKYVPRRGRIAVFDRSWYGRVLVERIEGFATSEEWSRAYQEINDFERELLEHGTVIVKFWLEVSPDEQMRRFEARAQVPYKRWKLTDEDIRNREKRGEYTQAVGEMVTRTGTSRAPWVLVESDDKRYARLRVLETVCSALEEALENRDAAPGDEPEDLVLDDSGVPMDDTVD